jgi:acetyl esterase
MSLDPRVQAFLGQMASADVSDLIITALDDSDRALHEFEKFAAFLEIKPKPIAKTENQLVPTPAGQIPVRLYVPQGSGPFPVLVYFHGGGFVFDSIELDDALCRLLTNAAGCVLVSVEYRLAPKHKFPAAVEDFYAAARWVAENALSLGVDPSRVAVGGSSAGCNLAAVVALMARDRGVPPLAYQFLMYPITNFDFNTRSYQKFAAGYFLTKDALVRCWNLYLRTEADGESPYTSPLRAENLGGLPPALVITAANDPLRDEGEAYATRLADAGVPVVCKRYEGAIHGGVPMHMGEEIWLQAAASLRSFFCQD